MRQLWDSRSRWTQRILVLVPLVLSAWAVGVTAAARHVHEARYGHDVFLLLDAAWRVLHGQHVHVDFYSPYGPAVTEVVAAVMRAFGANALAIPRSVGMIGLVAFLWSLWVAGQRASAALASWFAALVTLIAVGRHQLSFEFQVTSHSAYYNRLGYVLLAIIALECLVPPRAQSKRTGALGGASTGFLCAALLFVKPTFFLAAAVLLVLSAATATPSPARWTGVASGCIAGLAACGAMIGYRFDAMFRDYAMVAAARSDSVAWSRIDVASDMVNRTSVMVTAGRVLDTVLGDLISSALVFGLAWSLPQDATRQGRRDLVALVFLFWGMSLALSLTSWQWGESPLFAVLALAFFMLASRSPSISEASWNVCGWLTAGCVFLFVGKNAGSIAFDEALARAYSPRWNSFPEPQARGLAITGSDSQCRPDRYAARVEGAVAAISSIADLRVTVLDFSNPFPFLSRSSPPRGGGLCWHYGSTFSDDTYLLPDRMFGDSNVVLIPKCPEDASAVEALGRIYGDALQTRFYRASETDSFVVLRSNTAHD
ncbi:MAG: hypothetical protein ABTD50_05685 [Polyangiaceae bacterium]|jgi:hypothetical protein